jgi:hypothetical protein
VLDLDRIITKDKLWFYLYTDGNMRKGQGGSASILSLPFFDPASNWNNNSTAISSIASSCSRVRLAW